MNVVARQLAATLRDICCGTPHDGEPYPPLDAVVAAVRFHRIAPLARVALGRAGHDTAAAALEQDLVDAIGAHVRNLAALRSLAEALSGLPWVVVKGPVLSELAHPVPGIRSYVDVDVLVEPRDFAEAVSRLAAGGWRLLDENHRLLLERMPGELHLLGPFGAQVDLHWSLINTARTRNALQLRAAPLIARRTPRAVEQLVLPTLANEDALLHLCVHGALAGGDRLIWLVDVDQWVRRHPPQWHLVVENARATRTAMAVVLVLGRAKRVLHTPVPDDVLRDLDPRGLWRGFDRAVTRPQQLVSRKRVRSATRMVARASRGSTAGSGAELVRRTRAAAWKAGDGGQSAWQPQPDEPAFREFLSRVSREG